MKPLSRPAWFIVCFVLGVLLCFVVSSTVHCQTRVATATWSPVTTNINGGPLTCTVTYNLYRGTDPAGADLAARNLVPITSTTYIDSVDLKTVYYYAVTALCSGDPGSESPKSSPLLRFCKAEGTPATPLTLGVK